MCSVAFLQEEVSLFFIAAGDGVHWFLNLCASVKICVHVSYSCLPLEDWYFEFFNYRLFLTGSVEAIRALHQGRRLVF
jgi:hypothetical protein